MATVTSQLIVDLIDGVTGPARRVGDAISGMNRRIREAAKGASLGERIDAAITRNNRALAETRGKMLDAVATGYALWHAISDPTKAAQEFETQMAGIGIKSGMTADQLKGLAATLRQSGKETNQYTSDLAAGVDYLVGMGMSGADATAVIKTVGKTATAAGANVKDMSGVAFTAMSNLKVPADQLQLALDAAAQAGKRGGFEFRDMAAYLPALGAAYGATGQSGVGAMADLSAALQVIRSDTGDASSAATNLQNVIQKTYSPATVAKFKKEGVDLFAEMEAAQKRGLTPLEAIAEITNKTLKGDVSKIGNLFEDSQAQAGVRSLIQRLEQFRSIRADALGAKGTNEADFVRMMDTSAEKTKKFAIALSDLKTSIGQSILPILNQISDALRPYAELLTKLIDRHPRVAGGLLMVAAGFIGLKAALNGLRFVGLMGKGGALSLLSFAVNGLGGAMGKVGRNMGEMTRLQRTLAAMNGQKFTGLDAIVSAARGLALAAPGAGAFVSGLSGLGGILATISAPVWGTFAVAAAAIGAAGYFVWRYWDRITAVFSGVGQALGEILAPAIEAARPVLDWFAPLGDAIARGWEAAKSAVSSVGDWIGSIFQRETLTDADKEKARQAGYDFVMALWNGMKQVFSDLTSWVGSQIDGIVAKATSLGSRVKGFFSGAAPDAGATADPGSDPMGNATGARARGGPISRGSTYLVGERGPELITAGRSGYVNRAGAGGAGGPINISQTLNFNIDGKADDTAIEKMRRVMRDEVRETFRGVFSDTGLRFA